jgi:ABC-type Fe3+ transport system permease subunit
MKRSTAGEAGRHASLMLLGLWFLVPLYLVVVNSFKAQSDVLLNPLSAPVGKFTLESYRAAFSSPSFNISRAYLYSAIITVSVVAIVLLTASSLSYVMARSASTWARAAYLSILAGLMIPPQVVIIPAVKVLRDLGLIGTLPGLILYDVATNLPIAVFVYYGFIQSIPKGARRVGQHRRCRAVQDLLAGHLPGDRSGHRVDRGDPVRVRLERLPQSADHPRSPRRADGDRPAPSVRPASTAPTGRRSSRTSACRQRRCSSCS